MADETTTPPTTQTAPPVATTAPETAAQTPEAAPPAAPALTAEQQAALTRAEDVQRSWDGLNSRFRVLAEQDPKIAAVIQAALKGEAYQHLLTPAPGTTATEASPGMDEPLTTERIRQIVQEETRKATYPLALQVHDMSTATQFAHVEKTYGVEAVKRAGGKIAEVLSADTALHKLGPERVFKIADYDTLAAENARLKAEIERTRQGKAASVAGAPAPLGDRVPAQPDFTKMKAREIFEHFRKLEAPDGIPTR